MIEQNGTEIALVIALCTGAFLIWFMKDDTEKTVVFFRKLLGVLVTLSFVLYVFLRIGGVNP